MANPPGQNLLVIERILRDRDGVWRQINDQRDLRSLTLQMLTSSAVSLAIFGLVLGASNGFWQALSSMVKLPLLFLATLAICLPTLYLFNLVFGARLSMMQAVTLIMVAITVISVLTLAFAPISLFFLITAQNYEFFKLLNVCILGLTAVVGLLFLTRGMAALNAYHTEALEASWNQAPAAEVSIEVTDRELALVGAGNGNGPLPAAPVPIPSRGRNAAPAAAMPSERPTRMTLVYIWILLFGFVGTQLAWTLRPFFGDPDAPFALFREISGTFYGDIMRTIGALFG
ncbi:MAG TPA: hypothetical protein VJ301_07480 [Propionibacteriaceae bacterium]|nr:hypothetical protein [Propionibacteriaceae bacterium]